MNIKKNNWKKNSEPIYLRVAKDLRSKILSGNLKAGTRLPSEIALSASLGINHQTLRKSLKILAEQQLISQCPGRGTFVAIQNEEHLKIGVPIGNSIEDLNGDIYRLRIIAGLSKAVSYNHNGEICLLECKYTENIMNCYNQSKCDGLLILSRDLNVLQHLCRSEFNNVPMVFLNSDKEFLQSVGKYHVSDENGGVWLGMETLYAMGHRKIGFVCANNIYTQQEEKEYHEFCRTHDLKEYFRSGKGLWFQRVRELTAQLCLEPDRPTALIEPGFTFSYAAWQGIMDAGLKIPDDISFIGFDANQNSNPNMSCIVHSLEKPLEKAVSLFYEMRHKGKHLKQRLYEFPVKFEEHGSCRSL